MKKAKKRIRIFWIVMIIGLAITGLILWRLGQTPKELDWPREKIMESPENAMRFIYVFGREILKMLPKEILVRKNPIYTHNKTFENVFRNFLEKEMGKQVELIKSSRERLRNDFKLKLIMLPDLHPDAWSGEQNNNSTIRQRSIIKEVSLNSPKVVFVENISRGILTWERFYQEDVNPIFEEMGQKVTCEEFKIFSKTNPLKYWWYPFIDKSGFVLYGVDDLDLAKLVIFSTNMGDMDLKIFADCLNYVWREQIILANIVDFMMKKNISDAVIVIGEGHKESFAMLCKSWGVIFESRELE